MGVDFDDVLDVLEREGVPKFDASWGELVETVQTALKEAKQGKDRPGDGAEPDTTHDSRLSVTRKPANGTPIASARTGPTSSPTCVGPLPR